MNLSQHIPLKLKRSYWRWATSLIGDRPSIKEIDLERTLMGGVGGYYAGHWADITGEPQRASMLLKDSPHVKFLEQYGAIGEKLFLWETFEETSYFKNAAQCVQICKHYFGHRSREGIVQQARSFAAAYEQIKNGNGSPARLTFEQSPLPLVRETLTPNTFQIVDGHHGLAIAWVLGTDFGNPEELLKRIAAITGSYLFLETGQNHEQWYRNALSQWGDDFIINLIRQHTSFNHVLPLGVGSDNVGPYRNNYARTLFVCLRSLEEAG